MVTNAELRMGSKGGEYYGEGRWTTLNRRIDSFLRRIFGDFTWRGPRNWVGWSQEGRWSRVGGSVDSIHLPLALLILIIVLGLTVSYVNIDKVDVAVKYLIYFSILIITGSVYFIQTVSKKAAMEFLHAGNISEVLVYLKAGMVMAVAWTVLYLWLGSLLPQALAPLESLGRMELILSTLAIILFFPFIEGSFFSGYLTPSMTRYIGILPGVLIVSVAQGLFHYYVVSAVLLHVVMSILFALMTNLSALYFMSKEPSIDAHIIANTIFYLLR